MKKFKVKIKLNFFDKNYEQSSFPQRLANSKMAMTFNAMFNSIFDQISREIIKTFTPNRQDGKPATIADVRTMCDRVMTESFIQITFGKGGESKILHKPEEYKTCPFILTRGDRNGDKCGKKTKAGCECCGIHMATLAKSKVKKAICKHVFTKGSDKAGTVCTTSVADGGDYCSKHKKKSSTASSDSDGDVVAKKAVQKVPTKKTDAKKPTLTSKKSVKSQEFVKDSDADSSEAESESESELDFVEKIVKNDADSSEEEEED